MSRIGRKPVPVPGGVSVEVKGQTVTVKGPRGELRRTLPAGIEVAVADEKVNVTRPNDEPRSKALHGLTRALVANMVEGVDKGFRKTLDIQRAYAELTRR